VKRRGFFGLAVVAAFFSDIGRALSHAKSGSGLPILPNPAPAGVKFKYIVKMPPIYTTHYHQREHATIVTAVPVHPSDCPPGMVAPYIGETVPDGWKLFDNVADAFGYAYDIKNRA
jgi:hypothetical protein